jgi:hypothetical protein
VEEQLGKKKFQLLMLFWYLLLTNKNGAILATQKKNGRIQLME